jgi:hypothetical protein
MEDEAASRRVMAKACGSVTNGVMHIVTVVDAGTGSQKIVEKSLSGRAQRDDRRASADCSARATPLTPTNTFEITRLTRVEMILSIAQQRQAATAKSFVATQRQR